MKIKQIINGFEVACKLWVNESNIKLAYFKPWRIPRPDKVIRSEIGLFGIISVYTKNGFDIFYNPITLKIMGHRGELPSFYKEYSCSYDLNNVPKDTLILTLNTAKAMQEKGCLKFANSCNRQKFKGKSKKKM